MPDIFGSKHHDFRTGMGYRQLLDSDYQNKVKHAVEKIENSWAGFEGLYPVDYQLRQGAVLVRIIGRESLSDGTSRYLFQKIEPQNLDFTGNTSGPLTRDSSNIDSDLQGIYAYNLGNCQDVPIDGSVVVEVQQGQAGDYCQDVPIDGSVVVEVQQGQAGDYYTFKYDIQDTTIGQVLSVAANGSISWIEIEQSSSGTYQNRTFGLSGNETVNWATVLDSNLTVQAGDRGIFRRGHCEGGVRVVVTGTVAGDSASASHCSQEIYVENAVDGTFKLRVEGVDSGAIAWNSTTELGTEINTTLGGNASVTVTGNGTHATPWNVTFSDYVARSPMEADIRGLKSTQLWTYIGGIRSQVPIYADYVVEGLGVSGTNSTYDYSNWIANGTLRSVQLTSVIGTNVTFPANGSLVLIASANTTIHGMWQVASPGNMTKAASYNQSRQVGERVFVRKSLDLGNGTPNHNSTVWTLADHPATEFRQTGRAINTTLTGRVNAAGLRPLMASVGNYSGTNRASGRITAGNLTLGHIEDNGQGVVKVQGALALKWDAYVAGTGNATTNFPLWNYNTAAGADNSNSAISPNYVPIVGNGSFQIGTASTEMTSQLGGIPEGTIYAVANVGSSNITLTWNSLPTQNFTLGSGEGAFFIKNAGSNATNPSHWTPLGFGRKPKTLPQLLNETYGSGLGNGSFAFFQNGSWTCFNAPYPMDDGMMLAWSSANQTWTNFGTPTAKGAVALWDGTQWGVLSPANDDAPLISSANSAYGAEFMSLPTQNLTLLDSGSNNVTLEIVNGVIRSIT